MSLTYNFNKDWYLAYAQFAVRLRIDFILVLNVPDIPPKVTGIVILSGGRRKDHLVTLFFDRVP